MNQQQEVIEFEVPVNGTIKAQLCNVQLLHIIKDLDVVKTNNLTVVDDIKRIEEIQKELDQIRLRSIK